MNLGLIVEIALTETLFASPRHPYSRALLSAIPVPRPKAERERIVLRGEMPSALNPPAGCQFHTRCPYAVERCRSLRPQLINDAGHATACHLWPDLPAAKPVSKGAASPELERLIAAFGGTIDEQRAKRSTHDGRKGNGSAQTKRGDQ
jgi:peptide/nickel transport system ATP-binding protein/oligopeptide transport system ATP-binding protein